MTREPTPSPPGSPPNIDEVIDRFAADGQADMVRELTLEIPDPHIGRDVFCSPTSPPVTSRAAT
ncbi:MAG: hypothetical protein ACLPYY_05465 [Acidimicrobiales bacterium]